jgi:SAM-dependent methyltransferase
MSSLEHDLASYYDQEAPQRAERAIRHERVSRRDAFVDLLAREARRSVVEIGTGPGHDASALVAAGFDVSGVDLSPEHVRMARERGVDAQLASVLDLPFADAVFDSAWCMSTLIHLPNAHIDRALGEIVRVVRAGSPVAIGLWGGADREGPNERDTIEPRRFFSIRSDETAIALLGRHAAVEQFVTWTEPGEDELHYQFALIRTGS